MNLERVPRPGRRGLTLIELLVTIAIAGILAALAYPSFMGQIRKSRRADGVALLTNIQQAEERWRSGNSAYTNDLGGTGLNLASTSQEGHYTAAVTVAANGTGYDVTATAQGSQASDTRCQRLRISMPPATAAAGSSGQLQYSSFDGSGWTSSAGNPCWTR